MSKRIWIISISVILALSIVLAGLVFLAVKQMSSSSLTTDNTNDTTTSATEQVGPGGTPQLQCGKRNHRIIYCKQKNLQI